MDDYELYAVCAAGTCVCVCVHAVYVCTRIDGCVCLCV